MMSFLPTVTVLQHFYESAGSCKPPHTGSRARARNNMHVGNVFMTAPSSGTAAAASLQSMVRRQAMLQHTKMRKGST